jgi:hypothetical protein
MMGDVGLRRRTEFLLQDAQPMLGLFQAHIGAQLAQLREQLPMTVIDLPAYWIEQNIFGIFPHWVIYRQALYGLAYHFDISLRWAIQVTI